MITVITYTTYLCIATLVTVLVGRNLHRDGHHLILDLFGNELFTRTVNNLLLMGYYLVNIGYIALSIRQVEAAELYTALPKLADALGTKLLLLGALHFNNILVLNILSKHKHKIIQFFNT